MGKMSLRNYLFALICAFACGCTAISDLVSGTASPRDAGDPAEKDLPSSRWDGEGPRVRPGVVVVVQVGTVAQPPTSMTVQVDPNGYLTLPYLLQEPVLGKDLSLEALKQKLIKAYQVYIKQPQVSVTFGPYDPQGVSPWGYVTILGQVASPGPVNMPPTMDLTVTKAVKAAGGFRPFARQDKVKVSSCDRDGNRKCTIVNIVEIGAKGCIEKDVVLKSGDVVWVPESWY